MIQLSWQAFLPGAIPYADMLMGVFNACTQFVLSRLNMCHPTRTLWSDQRLDAVACEGSSLSLTTWMLCLQILNVDWTLIGPVGMLWGTV